MAKRSSKHRVNKPKKISKGRLLIGKYSFSKLQLIVFAVIFASIGGYILFSSQAASSTGNVFVAAGGSDSGANCRRFATATAFPGGTVCATFDKAYHLAQAGDIVLVEAGNVGDQTLTADSTKSSATSNVTIEPDNSASVTIHLLDVNGSNHITFDSMTVTRYQGFGAADHITFQSMHTGNFHFNNITNLSILGGEVGPWDSNAQGLGEDAQIGTSQTPQPTNILIDGVNFHDITNTTDPAAHTDCLQFESGNNVTIQNSTFKKCGIDADIFVKGDFGPVTGFTIQNNFFGASQGGFSMRMAGSSAGIPCSNILIRNNTGAKGTVQNSGGVFGDEFWGDCTAQGANGVKWVGNIIGSTGGSDCSASQGFGQVWDYNISLSGSACGTHATVTSVPFTNVANNDLHILAGSPAIDYIPSSNTNMASIDIDGQARPSGAGFDAGADEFGGTVTPPPPPGPTPPPPTPPPPAPPPPPPASDTTPPSVPTNLAVTGKTATSISISWSASTDNVAVAGYHLYQGPTIVGSVTALNYTFSGLTCNTNYTNLGLTAYDAAGNQSSLAQAIVVATTTNACSGPIAGDVNGDGHVTVSDLSILLSNWSSTTNVTCDLNSNGVVDIFDLSILLSHYGQ